MSKIFKTNFLFITVLFFGSFLISPAFAEESNLEVITENGATLASIAITTPATEIDYIVGENLDITGLVVTGTYDDASTNIEPITVDNISGFDSSSPVTGQILTITVGEQTATYTINVNPAIVHLDIEADVDVPASCSVTDTDGAIHNYPKGDYYLAICALEGAIANGSLGSVQFSNQFPSLGLFVTSINDVAANPENQYWSLYQNGSLSNSGLASLPVVAGDVIMLQLRDFSDNNVGDQVVLNIHSLVSDIPTGGNGNSGNGTPEASFNTEKAITYLKSVQGEDGSFANSLLYTDWAAVAFGTQNVNDSSRDRLLAYLRSHNTLSSVLTGNERRAMALLSLGQNPYSFEGVNYIQNIIEGFDGIQFGDSDLINDDIFALLPLSSAGYTESDEIIAKDVAFLISKQKEDGSFEGSVDITAATIQALKPFSEIDGVSSTLSKARDYIKNKQNNDGGWGNVSSTSWVIQAESSLNASWVKNGKSGLDYLIQEQAADGAVAPFGQTLANRIWATSYAVAAAGGNSWSEIMKSVSKPESEDEEVSDNSDSSSNDTPENTVEDGPTEPTITPVVCEKGNLFSATTGERCTEFTETEASTIPISPDPILIINTPSTSLQTKKIITTTAEKYQPEKEIIPETNSDVLTASIINSLPAESSSETVPIALIILGGIVAIYFLIRFLIK